MIYIATRRAATMMDETAKTTFKVVFLSTTCFSVDGTVGMTKKKRV